MLAEIFNAKKILHFVIGGGLLLALGNVCFDYMQAGSFYDDKAWFYQYMAWDKMAMVFSGLMIFATLFWFGLAESFFNDDTNKPDRFSILLFSLCGAIIMVSFADLSMLFIGIEILSISMYLLAASRKNDLASNESGFKYFLMGSFATGFLLMGIALIYGTCGTFNIIQIGDYISANYTSLPPFFTVGLMLLMVGMFFKVSAVPFHFWAPDVYQGAPTVITAYMSTIVKVAAFAAFFRLFSTCFSSVSNLWVTVMMIVSALSMLAGNILAVTQTSLKRMLAYSGIAHAGYMLMAIISGTQIAQQGLLMYSAAYVFAGMASFGFIYIILTNTGNDTVDSLRGFAKQHPVSAACVSVITLSLAGIPPAAGFIGKYYMFYAMLSSNGIWLVLLAVISSLIGVYYYFRIIIAMYQPQTHAQTISITTAHKAILFIAAAISLLIGIAPFIVPQLY